MVKNDNKLAKNDKGKINLDQLEATLFGIQDFLRLLDYYLGFEWAYQYIREETRKELEKSSSL